MSRPHDPNEPGTSNRSADQPVAAETTTGLVSLDIRDFRNFNQASLAFTPGLNLFTGDNASGKTSLLEAIYYLGRVRSFRTSLADQPIRYGQPGFRLVGRMHRAAGQSVVVGIERSRGRFNVRLGGQPVRRLSDLAGNFPVQVFSSDTATILSGGPRQRRHTLDWALFHVEHRYRDLWQRYTRALRQRNAALRAHTAVSEVVAWDAELLEHAQAIDALRRKYLAGLGPYLQREMGALMPDAVLEMQYVQGWPVSQDLADALAGSLEKDRAQGYTHCGPHRADFRLLLDGHPVAAHCSRGQQKAILLGLMLAQESYQQACGGTTGAFLLDDLGSELDAVHQSRVLAALRQLQAQVFVTAIQADTIDWSVWKPERVFHVEHGTVREMV